EREGFYGWTPLADEARFSAPPCYLDIALAGPSATPRPGMSGFVQLHAHSDKSALDGYSRIQEMVDVAVRNGDEAIAITDHGVCAGHPELQMLCSSAGIKPIFGIEA